MRNTEPYQKWPRSQPLMTGPNPPAAPVMLAQMAMALVRSSGGNTLMRIDSVDGMMSAAAAPITALHPMSSHIVLDAAASDEATRNSTSPLWSVPLRPKRSPRAPVEKSRPAKTSEYAATTHWSCDSVAWRSRASVGMVTFRLELPTKTMTRLRHNTASVHQRRSWSRSMSDSTDALTDPPVLSGPRLRKKRSLASA